MSFHIDILSIILAVDGDQYIKKKGLKKLKSHLQLKVGLIEKLLTEYGGVLIDGSQEDSEIREKMMLATVFNEN